MELTTKGTLNVSCNERAFLETRLEPRRRDKMGVEGAIVGAAV